ncbi:zinc ribbon domain-containing protein [Trichocoleus sp. Lan]|uniref:transposase n=1 Tax=Trichocoleus sp. Lan TaxID=2933927 RepID=UPI0032983121
MTIRALKLKFTPSKALKKQLVLMSWAARDLTNILVTHARYIREHKGLACEVVPAQGDTCTLQTWDSESKKWIDAPRDGKGVKHAIVPCMVTRKPKKGELNKAKPLIKSHGETAGQYWDKGLAWEILQALYSGKSCLWPRTTTNHIVSKGKRKGLTEVVETTTQQKPKAEYSLSVEYDGKPHTVTLSAKTVGVITRNFDGNFKSFLSNLRRGDPNAKPPYKQRNYVPVAFNKDEIRWEGEGLRLGSVSKNKRHQGITIVFPALKKLKGQQFQDAKITRSLNGEYWLHLTHENNVEKNPELTGIGAIDFGQKRAIVIANQKGETATISGNNICAVKRVRDRRLREIGRLRSRTLRGQARQYLSKDEQDKALEKNRIKPGSGEKYVRSLVAQRRRDGRDGQGRNLEAIGQKQPEVPLRKRSRRQFKILKASRKLSARSRRALDYANHCVTRAAVDWAVENKIGTLYVGELDNIPKGRKKGKRRMKQVKRNSLWEWPTQTKYLADKLVEAGGIEVKKASERFTSQKCPQCGTLNKPRGRRYHCRPNKGGCGWRGDRDQVGAVNFLNTCLERDIGEPGNLVPGRNYILRLSPAARKRKNPRTAPAGRKIRSGKPGRVGTPIGRPASGSRPASSFEPAEETAKGHRVSDRKDEDGSDLHAPRTVRTSQRKAGIGIYSKKLGLMQVSAGPGDCEESLPATSGIGNTSSQPSTLNTGAIEADSGITQCADVEVFSSNIAEEQPKTSSRKGKRKPITSQKIRAKSKTLTPSEVGNNREPPTRKKAESKIRARTKSAQSESAIQLSLDLWGTGSEIDS